MLQDLYNIPGDEDLNNETLELINTPRCGIEDPNAFTTAAEKWEGKTILKWHFNGVNETIINLTQDAFNEWSKHTNLDFQHTRNDYDILISIPSSRQHKFAKENRKCDIDFEGPGQSLAHGFFPSKHIKVCEIHIDREEKWHLDKYQTPNTHVSLYRTILHEIGHTLGIQHTYDQESIMFAFNNNNNSELSYDDINAIQHLYGKRDIKIEKPTTDITATIITPKNMSKATTTSTTIKPKVTTTSTTINPKTSFERNVPIKHGPRTSQRTTVEESGDTSPNFCDLTNFSTFLVAEQKLYIIYEQWVWVYLLRTKTLTTALKISDWLSINVTHIDGAYQSPKDDKIIMISGRFAYFIDLPTIKIVRHDWIDSVFNYRDLKKVRGIVNTYTGKTVYFYDDELYREFNEFTLESSIGKISYEDFPGIPGLIDGVFRYINGYLYFFKGDTFFEYSEFTKTIISTGYTKDLISDVFGIKCPEKAIIIQMREMLRTMLSIIQ